jgi:Ca2+-binding EF-hand superfamily protein
MRSSFPILAALALLSGCQTIQSINPFADKAYSAFDKDQDGVISQQEAQELPGLARNFDRADSNDSGGIGASEYTAATTNVAETSFQEADINADGVISERENAAMRVSLQESFTRVDADGDGNVSLVEYQGARVNVLQGVDFASIDTDGDGVIDPREAEELPALSDAFDRADTDADGLVGEEEFEAAQR